MTDVLIVGAAAAGLAAASAAAESQLSTVLLEADSRIGGGRIPSLWRPVARLIWVVIICIQLSLIRLLIGWTNLVFPTKKPLG